jgi:hypothetical protein
MLIFRNRNRPVGEKKCFPVNELWIGWICYAHKTGFPGSSFLVFDAGYRFNDIIRYGLVLSATSCISLTVNTEELTTYTTMGLGNLPWNLRYSSRNSQPFMMGILISRKITSGSSSALRFFGLFQILDRFAAVVK